MRMAMGFPTSSIWMPTVTGSPTPRKLAPTHSTRTTPTTMEHQTIWIPTATATTYPMRTK